MKILLFSPPFFGHLNVINYLKDTLNQDHDVKLVITGWTDIEANPNELLAKNKINSSDPMIFTLTRINDLLDTCIDICKKFNPHLIIYDFFSLEGYIVARKLSIPCYCSIPAMIGPYDNNMRINELDVFNKIKDVHKIDLLSANLQQVSDGILIPSDVNILWSYNEVINCHDYLTNRNLTKNNFFTIGPRVSQKQKLMSECKIIYVSFGTVVTQNLWNHNELVKEFVMGIFQYIINIFGETDYDVYISLCNKEINLTWPDNFHVFERMDQLDILSKAYVFITHCGGNSFNEAIHYFIPMIGIPFFGDQHVIGEKMNKLGIGHAFLHDDNNQNISTINNKYYRKTLTEERFKAAFLEIDANYAMYVENMQKIKSVSITPKDLIMLYDAYPLSWKNGDLLYGTNTDRTSLIAHLKLDHDFRIGRYIPFSQLFHDSVNNQLLPRIIDIYNDSLFDESYYDQEINSKFSLYAHHLKEFRSWLLSHTEFMAPVTSFDEVDVTNQIDVVWNMCLGGIEFFTQEKGYRIHFVLESYTVLNKATTLELEYIRKHWGRLSSNICFYELDAKKNVLKKVNPMLLTSNLFHGII